MKRVLSLVLVLVMVLSAIVPAFAEETASQEALDLETYGLITGNGTDLDEASPLTRAEMTVILAKLYGKATEAEAYDIPNTLTDIEGHWAVAWISYSFDNEWMVGDEAGTFRPDETISAQEVNTLMLKVLGYFNAWETADADAEAQGIAVDAADASLVLRGEIFKTLRGALDMPKKDATDTLGTELALTGYVAPVVEPTALEVASVEILNLKQVAVMFNQEIDTDTIDIAGSDATFKFYKNGSSTALVIEGKTVAEDGKTVVLTLPLMAQSDELNVMVEGVMNADELEVTAYEYAYTVKDLADPSAVSITVDNSKQLTIKFSEPINKTVAAFALTTDVLKIDDSVVVAKITPDHVNNALVINLGSSISVGTHDVWVGKLDDFAGFKTAEFTQAIELLEDATAPVVTAVEVMSPSKIKVTFDEPVQTIGTIGVVEAGTYTTSGHTANADNTVYTMTVDTDLGLVSLIEATLTYDGTADVEGNAADEAEFTFVAVDDTTKPTATIALDGSNNLTVTFDETMANSGVITIKDADDATVYTVTDKAFKTNSDDKIVEVAAATSGLDDVDAATYTVEVKSSKDGSVRANTITTMTDTVAAVDTKNPSIDGVILTDNTATEEKVTLYFSETMEAASIENEENFLIDLTGGGTFVSMSTITDATITNNGDEIVLLIPNADTDTDIKVLLVKDTAGNTIKTADFNASKDVVAANVFNAADISAVELIAQNQVRLTSTEKWGTVDPSNFVVAENGGDDKFVGISTAVDATGLKLTVTVNGNIPVNAAWTGAAEIRVSGTGVKDYQGNELTLAATTIVDKVKSTATLAAVTAGSTLTLNFNEAMEISDVAFAGAANLNDIAGDSSVADATPQFTVLVDDVAVAVTSYICVDADTVTITLAAPVAADDVVKVMYIASPTTAINLRDAADNNIVNFTLEDTVE